MSLISKNFRCAFFLNFISNNSFSKTQAELANLLIKWKFKIS